MAFDFIQRPSLSFLLGFLVAVAYIPGVIGAAISTNWLLLMFVMPLLICFCKIEIKFAHVIGLLFLIYAALSLAWTQNFNIGFFIWLQVVVLGLVFCFGSCLDDVRPIFKGLALGLGVSSVVGIAQWYGWTKVYSVSNSVAGLFVNQNVLCEFSAIMLLSLIVLKLWWWIPITIPGVILVHSRAALLALICGMIIWLWGKSKLAVYYLVLGSLFVGFLYYINYDFNISSIDERFALWKDTIRGFVIFGQGIGSYEILYPAFAVNVDTVLARPKYAHNDFLQYVFEFGIGTALLIPFVWSILKIKRDERIILYGIGIISLFSFPFHLPVSAFIGCLVAGYVTRFDAANERIGINSRSILSNGVEAKQY